MLKNRIIPLQLLLGDRLVKTVSFGDYRDVGDPVQSTKVYNSQNADELIFLNIARVNRSVTDLLRVIESVSAECFMPLAFGGGIRTLADGEAIIRNGGDKVVLNSACYENPELVTQIADKFGAQAVVVGIDARLDSNTGNYRLYSNCGRKLETVGLEEHVRHMVARGAGELLINSIDRDGTMTGYDIALIKRVRAVCALPLIGAGGAGNYEHLRDAFVEAKVNAVACGSLFNFGDNNPIRAKAFLTNHKLAFKRI